jgi:hypothetical protein
MKAKPLPDLNNLKEYLKLDGTSPTFLTWIKSPNPYVKVGQPAGGIVKNRNKMRIKFNGLLYPLHRIVYYLAYEIDPGEKQIDHIDRNALNNNPLNLRVVTHSQNQCNRKGSKNSTSKHKGVSYIPERNCWKVSIQKDFKHIHGGYFKSETEAAKKYNELAIENFGEFAVLNIV